MATGRWGGHQSYPVDRSQNMNTMVLLPWTACLPWLQFSNILDLFFPLYFFTRWTQMQSRVWQVYVCVWYFSDVLIVCSCLSLLHSLVTFFLMVFMFGPSLFFGISYISNLLLVLIIEVDLHVLIAVYLLFIGPMVIFIISTRQSSMNFYVVCQRFYSCLFLWKHHVFLNVNQLKCSWWNHQSPWLKN